MKRRGIGLLMGVLAFVLTACGGEESEEQTANPMYGQSEDASKETEQAAKESESSGEDAVEPSFMGHWEYTGYLDECVQWTEYTDFVDCDYDGDGLVDRVYREYYAEPDTGELCDYQIEFGNGEVILIEECWETGFPQIQHGDLTGDGRQEILFTQSYPTSTFPPAFGDVVLYEWTEEGYREALLPFSRDPDEKYTYCLDVRYNALPDYRFHATVLENDFQMEIELEEDVWAMVEDYDEETYGEVLWETTLVQENEKAYLECRFWILGRWCGDEVIVTVVKDNDIYRIDEMSTISR